MTWLSFALLVLKVLMELPALIEAIRKIWDAINDRTSNVQKREMRAEAAVILQAAYDNHKSGKKTAAVMDYETQLVGLASEWTRTHNVA